MKSSLTCLRFAGAAQITVARAMTFGPEATSFAEGLAFDSCNGEETQLHLMQYLSTHRATAITCQWEKFDEFHMIPIPIVAFCVPHYDGNEGYFQSIGAFTF